MHDPPYHAGGGRSHDAFASDSIEEIDVTLQTGLAEIMEREVPSMTAAPKFLPSAAVNPALLQRFTKTVPDS